MEQAQVDKVLAQLATFPPGVLQTLVDIGKTIPGPGSGVLPPEQPSPPSNKPSQRATMRLFAGRVRNQYEATQLEGRVTEFLDSLPSGGEGRVELWREKLGRDILVIGINAVTSQQES